MIDGRTKVPFVRLGDLLVDSCYGTSEPNTADGTTPVLGISHVRGGRVRLTDLPRTQLPDAECAKLALRSGDLLLTRTNSYELVGQTGLVEGDTDAVFASYLVRLRVDVERVDPRYLNYWMNSPAGRRQIRRIITRAVGQANVNPTEFRRHVHVPLPAMDEQRHVAAVLATWDAAIEKTELLVGLKQRHRLGLFVSAAAQPTAHSVSLGDLCVAGRGGTLSKGDLAAEGSRRCILYGELHTTYGRVATYIASRTNTASGVATHGDEILMPSASETAEDLASATAVPQDGVLLGGDMIVLRPRQRSLYEPAYLAHYITHMRRREVASLAQGNSVAHLYGRDVLRIKVSLPSFERQRSVAELMSCMQAEIGHLESLAAGYGKQREGLMQVLFHGEAGR